MSRFRLLLVPLGLVLALGVSATVSGQDEGRRRGPGGQGGPGGFGAFGGFGFSIDRPTLLGSEQVRTELKVSDEQKKKLDEVLAAHREAFGGLFSARPSRDASDEERQKAREERTKKTQELVKKTEAKIAEVLEKAQTQRLDEIVIQQQGIDALVSENVIAAVKLPSDQVEKIKTAIATRDTEIGKLRGGGRRGPDAGGGGERPNFEEIREKTEKLRKDAETSVLAMLTKEQSESFTKLKGQPFALDRQSLFRGGRGGRGGPGGGGGGGEGGGQRRRPPSDGDL